MKIFWILLSINLVWFSFFYYFFNNSDWKISKEIKEKIIIQNNQKNHPIKIDKTNIKKSKVIEVNQEKLSQEKEDNNEIITQKNKDIKLEKIILSKNNFISNIQNILKIEWIEKINYIKYIEINNITFPTYIEKNNLYSIIKKNDFKWEYKLYLIDKNNNKIDTWETIKFNYYKWNVSIYDITPKEIYNNIDQNIVLQWKWFKKVISLQLTNNLVLDDKNINIINDNVMYILIPKWIKEWVYNLNLMEVSWINKSDIQIKISNKK